MAINRTAFATGAVSSGKSKSSARGQNVRWTSSIPSPWNEDRKQGCRGFSRDSCHLFGCLYLQQCFGAEALLLLSSFSSFFTPCVSYLHPFPAVFCSFSFPQLANINVCIMVERSICVVYIKHQLLGLFHYHDGWKTCCSDQVANKAYALVCCLLMHSKTIQLRPQHWVWDLSAVRRLATCL